MTRRLAIAAIACGALALPAGASAHTGIESTSPRAGGTASRALTVVKVDFDARVTDATLIVKRNGAKVSSGDGTLADHKRQVRARLRSTRSGRHTATVRWLSSDGHVQSRTWSFRVR
jgi:methionine-rich copper-binding protein CopC